MSSTLKQAPSRSQDLSTAMGVDSVDPIATTGDTLTSKDTVSSIDSGGTQQDCVNKQSSVQHITKYTTSCRGGKF